MLEMLVQDEPLRARYVMIEARIPKAVTVERIRIEDLPSNWRDIAARETLQAIGTEWARKRTSAVLAVPSAVIPTETNYLLNPLHPDLRRIKTGTPVRLETDHRLIKLDLRPGPRLGHSRGPYAPAPFPRRRAVRAYSAMRRAYSGNRIPVTRRIADESNDARPPRPERRSSE